MATSRTDDNFFRNKFTTPAAYLVGVLLFFLPFVEIKCSNTTVARNTGFGLAIGSEFKPGDQTGTIGNPITNRFGDKNDAGVRMNDEKDGKMYVLALAALLLGVAGLLLSFLNPGTSRITMIIGIVCAVLLIATMVQFKSDFKNKMSKQDTQNEFAQGLITADFTFWFYLSVVSFLAAAFFSWKRSQLSSAAADIPQVKIENPGDQSEFPRSPSESDIG
jgi:hypothetical protein